MSAKNELQEYFQKLRLPCPEYKSERMGGRDHQPNWISTVKLFDGTEIKGEIHSTKSKAELNAAEKALEVLLILNKKTIKTQKLYAENAALLVDVENLPNFIDEINDMVQGLDIYAFIGHHHCLATKKFPSPVKKIESHSTRVDGTDTCMQVYTGFFLSQNIYNTYFIATRDHYGSTLVEMIMHQPGPWTNKTAHLVTQPNHLFKYLEK